MINERFTYSAVVESKQFFTLVPIYTLTKCKQDLHAVCLVDIMLKTDGEPNSLTVLFVSKTDIALAKRKCLLVNGVSNLFG